MFRFPLLLPLHEAHYCDIIVPVQTGQTENLIIQSQTCPPFSWTAQYLGLGIQTLDEFCSFKSVRLVTQQTSVGKLPVFQFYVGSETRCTESAKLYFENI